MHDDDDWLLAVITVCMLAARSVLVQIVGVWQQLIVIACLWHHCL